MKTLSIVTPCFNEESGIAACHAAVRQVMEEKLAGYAYEHLFIDNASTDATVAILRDIAARDPRVRVIVNARNFGPDRSGFHALLQARGDAVVPILADLQTPPAVIPAMVALWDTGVRLVIARRKGSDEGWAIRTMRGGFYRLLARFSTVEQIPDFMGFGLYDRHFVEMLRSLNEPEPFLRGLVTEIGFPRATLEYDQPARRNGRSSYRLRDYANFALYGLIHQSRAPLRALTWCGLGSTLLFALAGLVYALGVAMGSIDADRSVPPILLGIGLAGAVQVTALGIVGEYVGLAVTYARQFPRVVEQQRINDA